MQAYDMFNITVAQAMLGENSQTAKVYHTLKLHIFRRCKLLPNLSLLPFPLGPRQQQPPLLPIP